MDNTLLLEIETLKNLLDTLVSNYSEQSKIIKTDSNRIFELKNKHTNLKIQMNELYNKLELMNLYLNQFEKLLNEKNKLKNENKYLKEQWNE
ncbi:6807_t:CDS:1, partial [Diversispora eburnea]